MPPILAESSDAQNTYEDLSGVNSAAHANPYNALIEACEDDPKALQSRYFTHCTTRISQQKEKLLSPEFSGMILDSILQRLEDPTIEPGYADPRHGIVFWARPPKAVRDLVNQVQQKMLVVAPHMWLMPINCLHMTALEITHSITPPEVEVILNELLFAIPALTDHPSTSGHHARLIKPILSFDGAALALSFLPAAGEGLPANAKRLPSDDTYSYHHLRRDLFTLANSTGVSIESRYVVPSAHITIGRVVTQADHDSKEKMVAYIKCAEEVNAWLQKEYWPTAAGIKEGGEWIVGQEKGLDCRKGALWYGGGETVHLGKGIK